MEYNITISENIYDDDYQMIVSFLNNYYSSIYSMNQIDLRKPCGIYARNSENEIIGGLVGYSLYGWLYLDALFIDDSFRKKGLGTELLELATNIAIKRKCRGLKLECFNETIDFYIKNNYTIFYTEEEPSKNKLYYLKKII